MRPRSAGTFLMSRSPTSSKESGAVADPLDRGAVEILDGEQVLHARTPAPEEIVDLVDAVDLLDARR